jgi:hypothetical protein
MFKVITRHLPFPRFGSRNRNPHYYPTMSIPMPGAPPYS